MGKKNTGGSASSNNICTRCGKIRIVTKTYTETIGTYTITRVETSCPDPDCQVQVDTLLQKERDKRAKLEESSAAQKVMRK